MNNDNQNESDETIQLQKFEEQAEQLIQSLEKVKFMGSKVEIVKYQNFWCRAQGLKSILHYQYHFKARDSDIIIGSLPKSGTTWLKSLIFTIVNRLNPDHHPFKQNSPLLSHNPHELVYFLENGVYGGNPKLPTPLQLQQLPTNSPRLLSTHLPYASFPESIKSSSSCKIVYIARNPFDTFVSQWHWHSKLINNWGGDPEFELPTMEDYFEDFCLGKFPVGPYFDHVIEFWKQSVKQPNKVLFLKYEDLKGDYAVLNLKKLAEFVGFPFSNQEESEGVINDIMELCCINNLKELEVNKSGFMHKLIENKYYFRKGEVGDWTNHFTPSMVERIENLIQENFRDIDLSFKMQ
ncbi:Cytosolic sulfotransferase 1 [Bienertia sinuspersici]